MRLIHNRFILGGLRFECTRCGNCCRFRNPKGYVYLGPGDAAAISSCLNISRDEFLPAHCETDGDGALHLRGLDADCRFLEGDNSCRIWSARPMQCVAWPFWLENLNPDGWKRAADVCPGIGKGRIWSAEEIDRIATAREDSYDYEFCETLGGDDKKD